MNPLDRLLGRLYDHWFRIVSDEERERCKAAAERAWQEFHCGPEVVEAYDFDVWEREMGMPS